MSLTHKKLGVVSPTARLRSRSWLFAIGLGGLIAGAGCAPDPHRGPILLLTIDALRADMVGATGGPAGLTPALDAFAREADLATRAISVSSWTVPSMASLFSGLQPYRHGAYEGARAALAPELRTLPTWFAEAGWQTRAFRSNHWLSRTFGYDRGFAEFRALNQGQRAEAALAAAVDGDFTWIHVLPPHAPYVRRDRFVERIAEPERELPGRLRPLDLEPYFDPQVAPAADELAAVRALYQHNVAFADEIAGRLLDGLRRSNRWAESLVVVTSDHGEELEEDGQVLHGGNLHRVLVEVPLLIKLPEGLGRRLAVTAGDTIGTVRIAATLLDAAGLAPAPGMAPSLFATGAEPVLSELYLGNGTNELSLVDGGEQLRWTSRFAPPESDYYRARLAMLGDTTATLASGSPSELFARLDQAFLRSLPLTGDGAPQLGLWRWAPGGGVEPIADPARVDRQARRLRQVWRAANGEEAMPRPHAADQPPLSEEEAAELRALGYVAGSER